MPALTLLTSPWFWIAIVGLLSFGGGAWTGIEIEGDHRDAQLLTQERAYQQAYTGRVQQGNVIAAALATDKQQLADQVSILREQIRNAKQSDLVTATCPLQTSAGLHADSGGLGLKSATALGQSGPADPDVRFSAKFIRLYNDGIAARVPTAAGGNAGEAEGTGTAHADDILDNAAENGTRWAECRVQLNKVIEYETAKPQ